MAVYELRKRFEFDAAHRLPYHDGKCFRLHGHTFSGVVFVSGDELEMKGPKQGMLIDYGAISMVLKPMIDEFLDHHYLNESIPGMVNPTSENLAKWCFDYLNKKIPMLTAVRIHETCTASCTYRPIR
jgi:6-pyruvoyltetrahydropterin/6-carboxytetrahydropterin synthase